MIYRSLFGLFNYDKFSTHVDCAHRNQHNPIKQSSPGRFYSRKVIYQLYRASQNSIAIDSVAVRHSTLHSVYCLRVGMAAASFPVYIFIIIVTNLWTQEHDWAMKSEHGGLSTVVSGRSLKRVRYLM